MFYDIAENTKLRLKDIISSDDLRLPLLVRMVPSGADKWRQCEQFDTIILETCYDDIFLVANTVDTGRYLSY